MKTVLIILAVAFIPLLAGGVDKISKPTSGVNMGQSEPTADSALARADKLFQARDYQAALGEYEKTVTLAHDEFNRSVEIEALAQVARMNLILGDKEEGKKILKQAAERADDADPQGWSRYLGVKGRFEWKDSEFKNARATFEEMYDYCQSNSLHSRAIDAAHMVAIVAESFEDQVEWGKLGIDAAEKTDNEKWLGPLWNNLAGTYFDKKDFAKALDCYVKAREFHWRFSGEVGKLYADYHVGMTYRLSGKYDEAGQWLRPVLAWAERLENHSVIGQACEDLGEIEAASGNQKAALEYFRRARAEYQAEGYDQSWKEIWENINSRIGALESE